MQKICLITECELARSHGTGSQVLEIFHGGPMPYHHFYWMIGHGRPSQVPQSCLLADYEIPIPLLRNVPRRALRLLGRSWWSNDRVNPHRLGQLLQQQRLAFDAAYVVVGREAAARRAASILAILDCPFVLHVVDIMHEDGLSVPNMPGFAHILEKASSILSLNSAITAELRKFTSKEIVEVPIGQPKDVPCARAPNRSGFRVVMGGRPYAEGCELLAQALPQLLRAIEGIQIVNIGPHFADIPAALQPHVTDLGFVGDEAYRRILADSHAAFLSGPTKLDAFGKFSFPSRCSDYLMAGLPVIASIAAGSATEKFLSPIIGQGVFLGRTGAGIAAACSDLTMPPVWDSASRNGRAFAVERMSIDEVRRRVLGAVDELRAPDCRLGTAPGQASCGAMG